MPRTSLTAVEITGRTYVGFTVITPFDSSDVGNGNQFTSTGREELLIQNTNGGSTARKATVYTNTGGVVEYTLAAGAIVTTGIIPVTGFKQTADGKVYVNAEHSDIKFKVLQHP